MVVKAKLCVISMLLQNVKEAVAQIESKLNEIYGELEK